MTERILRSAKRRLGIDIQKEKYAYDIDEQFGWMAKAKIPDRWVATTCGYCSVGCGMYIGVKDGKAVSVRGNSDHPVNEGRLCPKGLAEHYAITAPNRAKWPLFKVGKKKFRRVDWNWAIRTMVERFRIIQQQYGYESLGVISTGQLVTEEFYALGKLVQLGFRTTNYDGNTTLCMASAVSGYKRSFGSDGPPGTYEDLEKSDLIFLIGANIADNHPILCYRLEKNMNKTMIVADPRVTKTAMMANIYLPIKPRTDIALINGMMHVIIEANKVNQDYIQNHTSGFKELSRHLKKYTPEYVSTLTGLSEEQIRKVALLYANAKAPFIGWTMGVNHSTQGTETVNVICNLALITGNVGRVGASPFSITGQCNAMGTREAGFASSLPGYRKFENQNHRSELAALWGVEEEIMPSARGMAYPDIIEGVLRGKIKGLWIIATNPLVSFPNQNYLLEALEKLDFLVVQDGYHPIPTSEAADLVLPAAVWGEKDGTYTNSERRVSKVNAAVPPPGEAKPDFEIFLLVAKALGVYDKLFGGWTKPEDAFEEWKKVSSGRLCDYSGLTYELIEKYGGIQWPFQAGEMRSPSESIPLYRDGIFQTEDGRAKLWIVENEAPPESPDGAYPFLLNTGRTVEHWHTRTKTGQIPLLNHLSPEAWVEMNSRDAKKLKLEQGDYVRVESRRGAIERIVLRVTETVAPGQIFIPFHYAEANANNLTVNACDPFSREPNYKQAAVRIDKFEMPLLKRRKQ
ncbi:MAG: molybdopterin oxidoreductase [Omnitrophica bacterium RIFCSPHIGHO2_02_FULL_46_11]|nr:MAG: molybdopterin oxidoreductase [Omnitrophica bacterium RIFCSPHIGHO2_02_FULL_46_11]OGW87597.1 MAG: molybdopterin oxidoreductase [Omnitrophica bacterium RIFCSPLOWO2_01_FULL_45_10b]